MMEKYAAWIAAYLVEKNGMVYAGCKPAVEAMVKAFPELKAVPGHVWVPAWGKRGHWWCATEDGEILDPTASQFPGISAYEPWKPGDEVRVGKCMNCGDELWAPIQRLEETPATRSFCAPLVIDGEVETDCYKEFCESEGM